MSHWVFAYGSNMYLTDLQHWMQAHGFEGAQILESAPARLTDYELVWNYFSVSRDGGAANVRPAAGATLHGVALRVDDLGLQAIDEKETHPTVYCRTLRSFVIAARAGSEAEVEGHLYVVTPDYELDDYVAPTRAYLDLLISGARQHGLPDGYVAMLERITAIGPVIER
jgi:hypothetical protein